MWRANKLQAMEWVQLAFKFAGTTYIGTLIFSKICSSIELPFFPFAQTELRFQWNWSFNSDPNALFAHTKLKNQALLTFEEEIGKELCHQVWKPRNHTKHSTILFCYFPWPLSPGTLQPAGCQISSDLYLFHTQKQKGFKANNLLNVIQLLLCEPNLTGRTSDNKLWWRFFFHCSSQLCKEISQ